MSRNMKHLVPLFLTATLIHGQGINIESIHTKWWRTRPAESKRLNLKT